MNVCVRAADWLTAWTWVGPRYMGRGTWMDGPCRREEGGGHWFVNREISISTEKERTGSSTRTRRDTRRQRVSHWRHFSEIPSLFIHISTTNRTTWKTIEWNEDECCQRFSVKCVTEHDLYDHNEPVLTEINSNVCPPQWFTVPKTSGRQSEVGS